MPERSAIALMFLIPLLACQEPRRSIADDYRIVPDSTTPRIEGTRLKVNLVYVGRNGGGFDLRHRIQGDTAQLWIRRLSGGRGTEEGPFPFPHYFFIPLEALEQKHIVLLGPGPSRYVLK